jgi:hypothetical protein
VVDAGPDFSAIPEEEASLEGRASDDGLPQSPGFVTLTWMKMSGLGAVTFGNSSMAATTVKASGLGSYVLRLVADDGQVKTFDEVNLTVALPVVSVEATDPIADELGLGTGTFVLTRSGSTVMPLTVMLKMAGTATEGVDYSAIPQTAVFLAGHGAMAINIIPHADAAAEGVETVQLTVLPDPEYELAAPSFATVALEDLPMDAWRYANFGADANLLEISGDLADPDGDGLSNLLEWAQGTSPLSADSIRPELSLEPGYLVLTYRRSLAARDVTFGVFETTDFANWRPAVWSEEILETHGALQTMKARVPIEGESSKIIRLHIRRDPLE